jgi:methyl acetate hydrolase
MLFHRPLGITDISYVPNPNKISMSYSPAPYKFDAGATKGPVQNSGGSGLQGSAPSYLKIIQAILNGGALEGAGRILKKETVDLMFQGHLSANEEDRKVQLEELTKFATESDPFAPKVGGQLPGSVDWGYGGVLTGLGGKSYTHGRAPNTLCWSGFAVSWAFFSRSHSAYPSLDPLSRYLFCSDSC